MEVFLDDRDVTETLAASQWPTTPTDKNRWWICLTWHQNFSIKHICLQIIQFVTNFIPKTVGGHQQPLSFGSRKLTIPKKGRHRRIALALPRPGFQTVYLHGCWNQSTASRKAQRLLLTPFTGCSLLWNLSDLRVNSVGKIRYEGEMWLNHTKSI